MTIPIRTLKGHTDEVSAVAVTFDGRRAVSASRDLTLRATKRGKQKQKLTALPANFRVAFRTFVGINKDFA